MARDTVAEIERAVIRVLLNDPEALVPVSEPLPRAQLFSDPLCAKVYRAMQELAAAGTPPGVALVAGHLQVDITLVQSLATGYNTREAREVVYLAEKIATEGQRRLLQAALAEALEMAQQPTEDVTGLAFVAMQMVAGTSNDIGGKRDPHATAVSKDFDARLIEIERNGGMNGYPLRSPWLNDKTGGLSPATIWVLTGPYKWGRKTALARGWIIDACRAGAGVAFYALEGDRQMTYAGLTAMLATERLLKWNMPEEAYLSDTFLLHGRRSEAQASAISEARKELDKFRLLLYDARDGIGTTSAIATKLRRDVMLDGVGVMVLDYLQLVGSGKLFDRLEATTHAMQRMIVDHGICGLLIAQLNEGTIYNIREDSSLSSGVKGGGDPGAAADYLFRSVTITEESDAKRTVLEVDLRLARHAMPGKHRFYLNPQSGWIMGEAQ